MDTLASKLRLPADKLHRGGGETYEESMWWAAAWVCFFGFFRVGEITVPTALSYDPAVHLSWGDVSISKDQQRLRVFLKQSKTDQYGRGTEVFIGTTEDDLCPVKPPVYTWLAVKHPQGPSSALQQVPRWSNLISWN